MQDDRRPHVSRRKSGYDQTGILHQPYARAGCSSDRQSAGTQGTQKQMERLCQEFERLCNANEVNAEALHVLEYLAKIYEGLQ